MEIKSLDKTGIDFLVHEEGLRLLAYQDSVGVWTIGVGCTYYPGGTKVKRGDKISREDAIKLFMTILKHYELTVYSTTRDDITQNMFNALVSICFNIGTAAFKSSTLLRLVNRNPLGESIGFAFQMWRNAGSNKGWLLARRKRETELYFK